MPTRLDRRGLLFASAGLATLGAAGCKSAPETCPPTGLTKDELGARTALVYVDKTPDPGKPCVRCTQYAATGDAHCGGCRLLKGPIHPNGYCRAFTPV